MKRIADEAYTPLVLGHSEPSVKIDIGCPL